MTDNNQQTRTDSSVYKTLLENTQAIPWKIDWATKEFTYLGPQIEPLLGWPVESWKTLQEWAERIHPKDRERVVNYCVSQCENGIDHQADYRALRSDGSYAWIRDVVHVLRENGEVDALVGFMFDISKRKRNEQHLERLKDELEALSLCDDLTGIANRRMLKQALQREWVSATRTRKPVSVILADIDFFKQYNDTYGHLAGDECLKKVATLLNECAVRPRDVVARYGGEEFVIVLPETDNEAAREVAERCNKALLEAEIPNAGSSAGEWLSISVGVATAIPSLDEAAESLLHAADQAMYRAKKKGRNCVAA